MTQQLPVLGIYFFQDVREGAHNEALAAELLDKFDTTAGVDRIYDNGFIQSYATKNAWS